MCDRTTSEVNLDPAAVTPPEAGGREGGMERRGREEEECGGGSRRGEGQRLRARNPTKMETTED